MCGIAHAHARAKRYEAAMEWADRCSREQRGDASVVRLKAATCARLGRIEEARDCVRLLLEREPGMTIAKYKPYAAVFAANSSFRVCARPASRRNDRRSKVSVIRSHPKLVAMPAKAGIHCRYGSPPSVGNAEDALVKYSLG
jgi:hypothetical protein